MPASDLTKVQIGYASGFELMPRVSSLLTWLALQGLAANRDYKYRVLQSERVIEFEFEPHYAQIGTYMQLKFS